MTHSSRDLLSRVCEHHVPTQRGPEPYNHILLVALETRCKAAYSYEDEPIDEYGAGTCWDRVTIPA